MKYRNLGKTSLKVSEIGLGTEYLAKQPEKIIFETLNIAVREGMNYIDVLFFNPPFLKALSRFIKDNQEKAILACHIGAGFKDGKHKKLRSKKLARDSFYSVKRSLNIDSLDIAIIQFVAPKEYEKIMAPRGLIRVARELVDSQECKFLGISIHDPSTALKAVESGEFDLLMTQYNFFSLKMPERLNLIHKCKEYDVGLVVIKPFAGGHLLSSGKTVKIPGYKSGGISTKIGIPPESTAIKNLAFILDNPTVSTVIPGVKNKEELLQNLSYYNSSPEERNFGSLVRYFSEDVD